MSEPDSINLETLTHPLMDRGQELYETQRRQAVAEIIRGWLKRKTLDYRPHHIGIRNLTMATVAETIIKALTKDKQIFFSITAESKAPLLETRSFPARDIKDGSGKIKNVVALQVRKDLRAHDLENSDHEADADNVLIELWLAHQKHLKDVDRLQTIKGSFVLADQTSIVPFPDPVPLKPKDTSPNPF